MKKNIRKKQNDIIGPILAVILFVLLVVVGIFIGRYIAVKMTGEEVNLVNMFTIIKLEGDKTEAPVKEVLNNGMMTIEDLCGINTGLCNKNVGYINIDGEKYILGLYYDFDSLDDENYIKLNSVKVGNFGTINNLAKLDNYLVLSEQTDDSSNFYIHVYNMKGQQKEELQAFYNNGEFKLNLNGMINYYMCDKSNKISDGLYTIKYMELYIDDDNNISTREISKEYGSC